MNTKRVRIIFFSCACIGIALTYLLSRQHQPNQRLCNTGGGVKIYGYDWVNDDILMKCDCQGKIIHKSGEALDSDYRECEGKINYNCYKVSKTFRDDMDMTREDFYTNMLSNSKVISCPSEKNISSLPSQEPFQEMTSLPDSYQKCVDLSEDLGDTISKKSADKISCVLGIYNTNQLFEKCREISDIEGMPMIEWEKGYPKDQTVTNPVSQCVIVYYNPEIIFPDNFDRCDDILPLYSKNDCTIRIDRLSGSYDKKLAQKWFDDCLLRGGGNYPKSECSLSYIKYSPDTQFPTNFKECWEWTEKDGYYADAVGESQIGPNQYKPGHCSIPFNSNENPELFSACQQKGGTVYPSIIVNSNKSSVCWLTYKST